MFNSPSLNTLSLLDAALYYAALGCPVFPLLPNGKRPLIEHGYKDASATTARAALRRGGRRAHRRASRPLARQRLAGHAAPGRETDGHLLAGKPGTALP